MGDNGQHYIVVLVCCTVLYLMAPPEPPPGAMSGYCKLFLQLSTEHHTVMAILNMSGGENPAQCHGGIGEVGAQVVRWRVLSNMLYHKYGCKKCCYK